MRVKKNDPKDTQPVEEKAKAAPLAEEVKPVIQEGKVKPTITIKAHPIISHPQAIPQQSNQVTLLNRKTGKKTRMGLTQAAKMERKYPNEFKVQ